MMKTLLNSDQVSIVMIKPSRTLSLTFNATWYAAFKLQRGFRQTRRRKRLEPFGLYAKSSNQPTIFISLKKILNLI